MFQPRDYQQWAVDNFFNYFKENYGNPIAALPTGTGKSIVITLILQRIFQSWPNQKILVLTHVKELIEQNHAKLVRNWPTAPVGINSASIGPRNYNHPIIFAGIGSIAKAPEKFGHVDLIIIDECHLVSPKEETMYRQVINKLKIINPAIKIFGLTATPWRLNHGPIWQGETSLFTDLCTDMISMEAFNWFLDQGYLSPVVPKKTDFELDVSEVSVVGGEYVNSQLQQAVDVAEITKKALVETADRGTDREAWLIFTTGIDHSIHAADMLNDMGIPAAAIHSKLKKSQRELYLHQYKTGKLRALTNNNVLTTGFDHRKIDLITTLCPTQSVIKWIQKLGRGTRPVYLGDHDLSTQKGRLDAIEEGGKHDCLVLDFGGNTLRLGPINDPKIPCPPNKKKRKAPPPVKLCESCGTYNHASVRHCISCGQEFKFEVKIKVEASEKELIKKDLPIVKEYKVDQTTYTRHRKKGRPDSIKISYYSGVARFCEYLCIEHGGSATRYARQIWQERCRHAFPNSVDNALILVQDFRQVTHVRVHINAKPKKVIAVCFDGTCFGKHIA